MESVMQVKAAAQGIKQYLPVLGMVLATFLSTFYIALGDNTIDASEWFMVATAGCGAASTYVVPRFVELTWLKPLVAGITAALSAAGAAFITSGISAQEWVVVGIQLLGGLGVVLSNSQVPLTPAVEPSPLRAQASG
jgi:hypothetical protein